MTALACHKKEDIDVLSYAYYALFFPFFIRIISITVLFSPHDKCTRDTHHAPPTLTPSPTTPRSRSFTKTPLKIVTGHSIILTFRTTTETTRTHVDTKKTSKKRKPPHSVQLALQWERSSERINPAPRVPTSTTTMTNDDDNDNNWHQPREGKKDAYFICGMNEYWLVLSVRHQPNHRSGTNKRTRTTHTRAV